MKPYDSNDRSQTMFLRAVVGGVGLEDPFGEKPLINLWSGVRDHPRDGFDKQGRI